MSTAELVEQFWPSIAVVAVVTSICVLGLMYVVYRPAASTSATWTTEVRDMLRYLKIGASIAVALCWIGALVVVSDSPMVVNGAINWSWFSDDANLLGVIVLTIIVIGLPTLATAFWIQLLRHSWSGTEVPELSSYLLNYSLWLCLIWSKLFIGW
jgi:hypothetical protein